MKKLFILAVAVFVLATNTVNAQDEQCFKKGTSAINLGVGFGGTISGRVYSGNYYAATFVPIFTGSYEYGIAHVGIGIIGAGMQFDFQGTQHTYINGGGFVGKERWTTLGFCPRATYHFDFLNKKKFDIYAIIQLNIYSYSDTYKETGPNNYVYTSNNNNTASIGVRPSVLVAARYFFTPAFGVYSELGYDISIIKVGLSFKFGGR